MSQRHPLAAAEAGRPSVWIAAPSPRRGGPSAIFDPEYAALRATLLSLARDGHRLIGRISQDHPEVHSRAIRGFLRRIDRFDEQTARRELEPVRRWVQGLKCRVLTTTPAPS